MKKDQKQPSDPPTWASVLVVLILIGVFLLPLVIIAAKFMWELAL